MTRRSKRFERRLAKRIKRRKLFLEKYDNYANVCNRINLFEAADLAKKNVLWKSSVQSWSIHQLLNTERLYRDMTDGKDIRKGFQNLRFANVAKYAIFQRCVFTNESCKRLCVKTFYIRFIRGRLFMITAQVKKEKVLYFLKIG